MAQQPTRTSSREPLDWISSGLTAASDRRPNLRARCTYVKLPSTDSPSGGGRPIRSGLLSCLAAGWGICLSVRIHRRNSGQPKGRRFARWRENGGASYSWTGRWKVPATGPGPVDRFALEAVDETPGSRRSEAIHGTADRFRRACALHLSPPTFSVMR